MLNNEKAVMKERYGDGRLAIAKCWDPEQNERLAFPALVRFLRTLLTISHSFEQEVYLYQRLAEKPNGYQMFPMVLGYGHIICSSVFSAGHTIVVTLERGQPLTGVWDNLGRADRQHVVYECRKAIVVLRSLRI